MTESSLYEIWVNSLAYGFRNKGLTCQMKTDGTACQRSGLEFWHVVFLFAIRNCYIRKESHGFTNTIARVENINAG